MGAQGYARGRFRGRVQSLHRVIADTFLDAKPGFVVDHINGDKLDNRLCNLRVCLQRENARNVPMKRNNTSGVVGVSWDRTRSKWLAHIKVDRKFVNLGWYDRKDAAIAARKAAERKHFGEFAYNARPF